MTSKPRLWVSPGAIPNLETRTHIIFACNDPFFSKRCIPADDSSLSADVTFELVERAGHVAFEYPVPRS